MLRIATLRQLRRTTNATSATKDSYDDDDDDGSGADTEPTVSERGREAWWGGGVYRPEPWLRNAGCKSSSSFAGGADAAAVTSC
jgi:hypothetical protein